MLTRDPQRSGSRTGPASVSIHSGQAKAVDLGPLDGSAKSLARAGFKLLEAIAAGTIPPESAASAAGILEIAARALQTSELEERLERIENPPRAVPAITHVKKVEEDV